MIKNYLQLLRGNLTFFFSILLRLIVYNSQALATGSEDVTLNQMKGLYFLKTNI